MDRRRTKGRAVRCVSRRRTGFTLVELLTVVAIITLLIGILVPTLSRARQQAKATATRAILKSIGAGLDLFKNENPKECRGGEGYPNSAMRDDPTEREEQWIFGAQWLVRYLMGKDLHGYAPRRNVPRDLLDPDADDEEVEWYEYDTDGTPKVERVGPYLSSEAVKLAKLDELPGYDLVIDSGYPTDTDAESMKQPVILDAFGYPILYYVANPRQAAKPRAFVAGYDPECDLTGDTLVNQFDLALLIPRLFQPVDAQGAAAGGMAAQSTALAEPTPPDGTSTASAQAQSHSCSRPSVVRASRSLRDRGVC